VGGGAGSPALILTEDFRNSFCSVNKTDVIIETSVQAYSNGPTNHRPAAGLYSSERDPTVFWGRGAKPPDPHALSVLANLSLITQITDRNSTRIVHDSGQAALPLHPTRGLPQDPKFCSPWKIFLAMPLVSTAIITSSTLADTKVSHCCLMQCIQLAHILAKFG